MAWKLNISILPRDCTILLIVEWCILIWSCVQTSLSNWVKVPQQVSGYHPLVVIIFLSTLCFFSSFDTKNNLTLWQKGKVCVLHLDIYKIYRVVIFFEIWNFLKRDWFQYQKQNKFDFTFLITEIMHFLSQILLS